MILDAAQIAALAPKASDLTAWAEAFGEAATQFYINTPVRLAAFFGQVLYESAGLTRLEEDLNYSAARLVQVWPREFPTIADATPYADNPQALANRIYANRDGNGPESSGDGWRYHGRGPIQITGRTNYQALSQALAEPSIVSNPELLITAQYGSLSAAWYWNTRGLNALVDAGDFAAITRKINGSLDGEADREAYWHRAQQVFV